MSTQGGHGGHGGGGMASDDELDPDEPRTPLWLPLLGLCLFVGALVYAMSGEKPAPVEEGAAPAGSASAAAAPPAPH